jgi:hypothetical protein
LGPPQSLSRIQNKNTPNMISEGMLGADVLEMLLLIFAAFWSLASVAALVLPSRRRT